jgi:hypothetical protein
VLTTFVCVVVGCVFFRASDVPAGLNILSGMLGLQGLQLPMSLASLPVLSQLASLLNLDIAQPAFFRPTTAALIAFLLAIVWIMPNTQQWMRHYRTALAWRPRASWLEGWVPAILWRPAPIYGIVMGVVGFYALARALSSAPTEFLYFQF